MNHKETAKYIREYLKVMEIKARVQMQVLCGAKFVEVIPPTANDDFSIEESRIIKTLAKGLGMTHVQGLEIVIDQYTAVRHSFVCGEV